MTNTKQPFLTRLILDLPQHLFVWGFCIFILIPIVYIIVSAFKSNEEINRVLTLPSSLNFDNFAKVARNPAILSGAFNSIIVTSASLILGISTSALAGYAIGRAKERIFTVVYLVFLAALMIPNAANLATIYTLIKSIGLLNSRLGLILVYAAGSVPVGVLLYAGFIKNIPIELDEAAVIDGCGYYQRFFRVILPLLIPAMVTHAVLSGTSIWNDFTMPFLLITSSDKRTLPTAVSTFSSQNVTDYGPIFAMLALAVIPPVVFFLLMQRYFYSTVAGAVKG